MDDELRKQLSKKFGLNHFRSTTQKDAIKAILKNEQDVLVQMPSGSRKSLCFQLPGILQDKATIVISPRSSAIKDQIHYLKKYKIVAKSITSTTSDNEAEKIFNELMSEKPKTKFLFVTPDASSVQKLTDKLQSLCTNDKLAYLAVDEAQCVSPMLQDFRKDYQEIGSLRKISSSIPWIVLTHNASMEVSNDIVEHLQLHKPVAEFRKSSFRKNLYYEVIFKNTLLDIFANLKQYVVNRLESAGEDDEKNNKKPSGIIFCKNRETVELVAKKLTEQGFSGAKAHHGGLTDRRKIQNDWISGLFPVIITTTSSGGGIDKSCVRFVVHWDVPCSISNYYKESGLAGQDGKLSYCRIYYCHEDMNSIDENLKEEIATSNKHNIAQALRNHADFLKMCDHCEMVSCRHKMFSDYFNDTTPNCKDQCDACKDRKESEIALSIFKQLTYTPARNTSSILDLELPDTNLPMTKEEPRNPQYDSHTNEHFDDFDDMSGIETDPFPLRRNGYISPARLIAEDNCDYSQVPRCVSPAETVIDVKTNLNDNVNAIFLNSAPSTSQFSQTIVVKTEPTEMTRDVEETTQTSYSTEFTGLTTSTTQENQLHQDLPDTATASETGRTQPATVVTSETCRIQPRDQLSGTTTPIKQERTVEHPPATDATSETYRIQPRDQLSGIETPIKQERTVEHPPAPVATLETYRIQRKDQLSGIATPIKQERTVEHLPPPVATLETYRIQRRDQLSGTATPIKQERTVEHLPPPVATLETYRIQRRDQLLGTATPIKQERTVELQPATLATVEIRRTQLRDQSPGIATPIKHDRASTMSRESVISLSPTRAIINDDSDVDMGCVDAQHSQTQRVTNRERITQQKPAKIELSKILCKDSHLLRETNKNKKRENYGDVDLDIEIISDDSFTGNTPSPEYRTASPTKFSRSHEPYKSSKTNATNSRARYQNSSPIRSRSGSSERFKRSKMRRHSRSRSIEIFERDRSRSSEGYDRGAKHHRKSESTRRTKRRHPSSESEFSDSSHRRREKESGQRHHGEGHRHRKRKRKHKKSSRRDHKNDHRREDRNEWHSSERSCSPQPGTSKNLRRNPAYDFAKMRFSLSPEAKDEKESVDYGWEDSPPPKPEAKPEADPKYLGEDFNEKIKILQDRVQNEYDLEKIEEASKDLFRAVEEKIAIEANRKLKELDSRIQKRKDDYALKLFGTTNFDSWDDDPALSNVAAASKLKKFKPLVPDDIPLLEKMSMKYVIKAYQLIPTRRDNELVFKGHIKEIETEFQNRQMPPHLLDSIKKEKTTIAEIVKQYLKPYYNLGRFEPKDKNFFGVVARKICHVFYDRQSDENTIKKFIDSIFMRENKITRSTNLDFSI